MFDEPITSFRGRYAYLSNFYITQVPFEGAFYPSAEHAFQAAKTTDKTLRKEISNLDTPIEAKRAGRELLLRHNWENIKNRVMLKIVRSKFSVRYDMAIALSRTEGCELIERNNWGDRYWGMCWNADKGIWEGKNRLGRILMIVRKEQFKIAE